MTSSRWQAQGNVYLVIEGAVLSPELVRERVGDADGIIEIVERGIVWLEAVVWNPDGSQAEMSGNGTRIAAKWLAARTGAQAVAVRVGNRTVEATLLDDGLVEQNMGEVIVGKPEMVEGVALTTADVGNPHAVIEGDPEDVLRLGPLLETHRRFPNHTNVQVARRTGENDIEARVWERGAGETASSGTSAVAIAAALGMPNATVHFPGGDLHVRFEGTTAFLTGPAEPVAE
jgi:diaminopimelate epimerase